MNGPLGDIKETFPPTPPYREKPYPNPNGKGKGKGEGQGQDARACEASRQGQGQVGIRQTNGQGKGRVRIDRNLFFDPLYDPVQIALLALGIPQRHTASNGKTYNHARIMRWYLRQIGEENFRELAYRQWRENVVDGEPRSRAAAFMAKLYAAAASCRSQADSRPPLEAGTASGGEA